MMIYRNSKNECKEVTLYGNPSPDNQYECDGILTEDELEVCTKCIDCNLYWENQKNMQKYETPISDSGFEAFSSVQNKLPYLVCSYIGEALAELKNYELLGYTPEELQNYYELIQAYKDGRVIIFNKEDFKKGSYDLVIDLKDMLTEISFTDLSVGIQGCSTYEKNLINKIITTIKDNNND